MIRAACTAAQATALAVVIRRLANGAVARPALGPAKTDPEVTVSVVVPARNEAERLPALLDALASMLVSGEAHQVVVVDDESDDDTARLAAAAGAHVVAGTPRPSGWAGKTWALQQGIEAATGEWVILLDADVRPEPGLLTALVSRATADRSDLLSVGGRFVGGSWAARWLHASMLVTLVNRFGPPGQPTPTGPQRVLANGQCIAVRRRLLDDIGGWAPVARSLVEDVALARHLVNAGYRVDFLDAASLLRVEHDPTFTATWRGWGRSLLLPGVDPWWRQALDVATLVLVMPLPLVRLVLGRAGPVDAAALAIRVGITAGVRPAGRGGSPLWLSPLADVAAIAAQVHGVLIRRPTWRGRRYDRIA